MNRPSILSNHRELQNRSILGVLLLGHMVNDWVFGALWLLAPAIAVSMGLGPVEIGLLLTINVLASGLVYVPAGMLADRMSNQGFLLFITFWWVAVGYLCASLASGFWVITLLLAFGTMGDAFWHPVATGILVKKMPQNRAQALGIHALGGSVGAEVLGPLTAGFLLGFFDWRVSLQILLLPAVLTGFAFIFVVGKINTRADSRISLSGFMALLKDWMQPRGLGMMAMMVFYNMSLFAMLAMTPLTLQNNYQISPFLSGVIFAGTLVTGAAFQPHTGKVSDKIGRKPVILLFTVTGAAFAFLAGMVSSFWPFVLCLVISVSLLTAVRPAILAAAVEYSGRSESTTMGLVFAVLDGVGSLGALIAGLAGEQDLSYAYLLAGGLAVASVGATAMLRFAHSKAPG
ncbi:MAG: MFS transporter [Gammaproteobacteria bacterium]|nr:MFS transporter [Gammaproteobacteria bacterium]